MGRLPDRHYSKVKERADNYPECLEDFAKNLVRNVR